MTPIEPLQVSEVVERLEAPVSRVRERAGCQNCDDDLKEKAAEIIRTLQSENEALRAAGEEARRALESVLGAGNATRGDEGAQFSFWSLDKLSRAWDLASKAHRGLEEVLGEKE